MQKADITKNIIETANPLPANLERLRSFVPKELIPYFESIHSPKILTPLNTLNTSLLPFNFYFNTRGGWITPDGAWYLRSLTANYDEAVKNRLKDSKDYNFNTRLQAFSEGWIRLDWKQQPFSMQFVNSAKPFRRLKFTFAPIALKNQDAMWAVQNIARMYAIIMPIGFTFEISLVNIQDNELSYKRKIVKDLSFFLLELNNIKRKI